LASQRDITASIEEEKISNLSSPKQHMDSNSNIKVKNAQVKSMRFESIMENVMSEISSSPCIKGS
jgi:3'-phosphoadenosine 5'-phosphosulfate sulfotransferase